MKRWLTLFLSACSAFADVGVLLPGDKAEPDPTILALDEMAIKVTIFNGNARVNIRQVFANRKDSVQEGTYMFALPSSAAISDFAVWDDVTRIPGVIMERKRAEELYEQIRLQAIDPGLLQQGQPGDDSTRQSAVFTAKVVPIPAFANKRLEMEYQERLRVDALQGYFAIPLKPDSYKAQTVGRLTIEFELRSHHKLKDFQVSSKTLPLQIASRTANRIAGRYEARNVTLSEDFALTYTLDGSGSDSLEVSSYKDGNEPGFFEASALLTVPPAPAPNNGPLGGRIPPGRNIVVLFDASVSMQWHKLEQSYQVFESVLKTLSPNDTFNVVVFNSDVAVFSKTVQFGMVDPVEKALAFVKASRLRGGTNIQTALETGLKLTATDSYLVLITDGGATRGIIQPAKLAEWYKTQWNASSGKPRTYVFGVGDDANLVLLRFLAQQNGVFEWVRSGESLDFKLKIFLSKIGARPVEGLKLAAPAGTDMVYSLDEASFPGSTAGWVGQYSKPGTAKFSVSGMRDGKPLTAQASVNLPAQNTDLPYLPRAWAKARVDALLDKINREGEDTASIDEIIRLSRKYKFITPYTSFLAAPRSLLRPRLIRPGDPVLRIKTDSAIQSVVAMFPFGLVKKLRYLENEDTWQTRFLAPSDMKDGTYQVKLLLRDRDGRVYREQKSFVIASTGPIVKTRLDKTRYRGGEAISLKVSASETTRTITARLYGAMPVRLQWNPEMKFNTGSLVVPAALPAGRYLVTVTAEDFAHNVASQEVAIDVVP